MEIQTDPTLLVPAQLSAHQFVKFLFQVLFFFQCLDISINFLYLFKCCKEQIESPYLKERKEKKKNKKSIGLFAFAFTCFNTGENPEQLLILIKSFV